MRKCIKSLIGIMLVFAMLIPSALPVAADTVAADNSYGFIDFPTGWSAPAMSHAVANGIIQGKTSDRIAPEDNLTRAEMATIINRAFGATVKGDISKFTDVDPSAWYYAELQKAYNMQTIYGDEGNTMRPDAPIIREEAIAIVARAMVLSGYSASNLDKFQDKGEISGWAVDSLASMAANGYVNGDNQLRVTPKANITREEFAQLIYNIIKHYYNPNAKSNEYQGNLMLNKPDISLKDITVNGDLILGDGVGTSKITLTNIDIKGRLLVRGSAQITLKNVTTGKGVVVKNVNGTVHFDNYRDEKVFDGVVEHTTVTYKKKASAGGIGGGGVTPPATTASYKVEHYQENLDGTYSVFETENLSGTVGTSVTAVAKTYTGFSEDAANALRVASGTVAADGSLVLKLFYNRNTYTVTFDFGGATLEPTTQTSKTDKYGATVVIPTTGFTNGALNFAGWFTEPNGAGTQVTEVVIGAANTTVYAYWTLQNTYKVEHYQENLDGTYTIVSVDTQILTEDAGNSVTATPKTYVGFHENTSHPSRVPSGTVLADNSLVLKLYYARNTYTFTFDAQGGTISGTPKTVYKYGDTLDLPTPVKGTDTFGGWFTGVNGTGTPITNASVLGTDVTGDVTVYAHWIGGVTPPATTASYKVEHYQENLDGTYSVFETENLTGTIGASVTATVKTYEGFHENTSHPSRVPSGTVLADNSLVLKLYYARNTYTFTFDAQGGTISGTPKTVYKYGDTLDLPTPVKGTDTFGGWFTGVNGTGTPITNASVLGTDVTGDVTVYAYWISGAIPTGTYTVEHYKEDLAGAWVLAETDPSQSTPVGTVLTAATYQKTYPGFTLDAINSPDVTVASENAYVLVIKYARNSYNVTYNYGEAGGSNTVSYKYGANVDLTAPAVTVADKYFAGWFDALTGGNQVTSLETPIGGTTIYAQWSDNPTYTVKHYKEALDGSYPEADAEIEYIQAGKDATVVASAKAITGFVYSHGDNGATGTNNGSLEFKLYYNRERYNVTFNAGLGSVTPSLKEYKYGEAFVLPVATREYYKVEGWYTQPNGAGTKISAGDIAGTAFAAGTLYANWVLDWDGKVKFTASAQHIQDDEFSIVVDISNNVVGISEYELTLAWDNIQVKPILVGGNVVTDLNGLGGNAIVTSADSVTTDAAAAALDSVTVNWNNATNVAGSADLFTIRFKILNTKADVDHESVSMFNIDGLQGLPFEIKNVTVAVKLDNGQIEELDKETEDTGLAPYKVDHYKENAEDDDYSKAYTEYGYETVDTVIFVSQAKEEYLREGFSWNRAISVDKAVVTKDGAILELYYTRPRVEVNFNYQGATTEGISSVSLKLGQKVEAHLPDESTFGKTDYNFGGWYTQPNGAGTKVDANYTVPAGGVTLYANWVQTTYKVEHYQQNANDDGYTLKETEEYQAKAGAVVTATAKTYFGFDAPVTMPSETVAADGSTVIKVYYTRKVYTINYEFAGGTAVGTYETTFKYGQSIKLPTPTKANATFVGWYTQPDGNGSKVTNTANIDKILGGLTGNVLDLYARWYTGTVVTATFEVEHYKENLDGTYPVVATEIDDEEEISVGETLEVAEYAKAYEGFTLDDVKSVDITVNAVGHYILEIYYKRNVYTLNYNYSNADTEGVASATFKYGQTITLPEEGTYSKEGFIPTGWYKSDAYNETDLVDEATRIEEVVDIANGATDATIFIKWDQFFTVTFKELGVLRHTSKVYPGESNTVPQTDIDTAYNGLVNPYIVGYRKDATVSPVYAADPYEHKLYGDWYYYEDGEYILFTDKTVINKDLTVRYMFRKAGLELNVDKLSQIIDPTFEVPFESDTRIIDTAKDATFLFEEKLLTAFDSLGLGDKFDKVNDKIVELLASKGFEVTPGRIFSDDGEILYQHVKFNAFEYVKEETLKNLIVKTVKDTLKKDPSRLRGMIDEMMAAKDPQVIDMMDSMLVSMLSGSDSQRIKDVIAESVEKAVANDTTGSFKNQIKDIIIAQLDAGNTTVETSIKDAVYDYFMNTANDEAIKKIVADLIEQAFATDDENDPIRKFIKSYITDYLNTPAGSKVLDDMIRDLGENLDPESAEAQPVIKLIHDVLDANVVYLEELVDGVIEDLDNLEGTEIYNVITTAITDELMSNEAELKMMVEAIGDVDVTDFLSEFMADDYAFKTIVETVVSEQAVFESIISTALNNDEVFETLVTQLSGDATFFNMMVDVAISNNALINKVSETVVNDDEALTRVLKSVPDNLKQEIMDDILSGSGGTAIEDILKAGLDPNASYYADAMAAAKAKVAEMIEGILTDGIDDTSEYWQYVTDTIDTQVAAKKAEIMADLADGIDETSEYWQYVTDAIDTQVAAKKAEIMADLADGIDDTSEYWQYVTDAIDTQVAAKKAEIMADLADGIDDTSEYWQYVTDTIDTQVAAKKAEIMADLADGIEVGSAFWNEVYPAAKAEAHDEIEDALTTGIDSTHEHWNAVYDAAKITVENNLINQGITEGSPAWDAVMGKIETALESGLVNDADFGPICDEILDEAKAIAESRIEATLVGGIDETSEYWQYAQDAVDAEVEAKRAEIEADLNDGIEEGSEYWGYVSNAVDTNVAAKRTEIEADLNDGIEEGSEYWNYVSDAVDTNVAAKKAEIIADLADGIEEGSQYWNDIYPKAVEEAEKEVEKLLTEGEKAGLDENHPYWNQILDAVKNYITSSSGSDFNSKLEEAMKDPALKGQIKTWITNELADETSSVRGVLANYIKGLDDTNATPEENALKNTIINSVVDYVKDDATADADINALIASITAELNANDALKTNVVNKTIEILSQKDDKTVKIKETVISSVVAEISKDKDVKGRLIDKLVEKITGDDADANLKHKVIDAALYTVVHHEAANHKAIELVNEFIETDPTFKENIIEHIVDYVLTNADVRKDAMEKVVAMIEDPNDTSHKQEAIDFAFEYLGTNKTKRDEVVESFLGNILGDANQRKDLATQVIDIMFGDKTLRNQILELGFEQMFSNAETIKEIVKLALDELIKDNNVRREMILAVIDTKDGRDRILDILFEELARDDTLLDKIIELAMEGEYGDIVDQFVYDLVNRGKIQINPENVQVVDEMVKPMLDGITADVITSRLPAKLTEIIPEAKVEELFNKVKGKMISELDKAIEDAKAGVATDINVMLDHDIDVVNKVLIPAYNKVFPRITDKAEDFYYYNENQYIKAIVDMLDPEVIFEKVTPSEMGTGYRVRDSRYYYEMLRNTLVLADDAGQWYLDNISDAQIDNAIAKFMSAYNKAVTKLNSLAGGRIPEDKLNTIISYVEKAIDKRQAAYDSTTAGAFEVVDKLYNKIIAFVKEKVGTDLSTGTVIKVTFDGSELSVNGKDINIDNYKINVNVKGYTFALNSREITVGGKTVDISGYVQKIANKFGTRKITVRFCEEVPYSYELSVGNNSIRLSAFYEG